MNILVVLSKNWEHCINDSATFKQKIKHESKGETGDTDTVYLENFRDSLFSLYLHKYSHFTREISF